MKLKWLACATTIVWGLLLVAHPAGAQEGRYQPPQCQLNTGHFLVKNSQVYLKGASEEKDSTKARKLLENARQNLVQALESDQAENPAAWYFLGRYYVMSDDAAGADSAFERVLPLAPDCERDITFYRMVMWAPRINEAITSLNAGNVEEAKRGFRDANTIYDVDNIGYYYLGVIYGQENELDSARQYFKKVAEVGAKDSTREKNLEVSVFNVGLLYGAVDQWDSARVWYEQYHEMRPDDPQGFTGLATTYTQLGDTARAAVLYDSVFAYADSLTQLELFQAGQTLFHSRHVALAARAFELGLEKNSYHRDGLYNLTNSYLAIAQDTTNTADGRLEAARGMERAARRLVAVEPMGHEALRLLAASFQLRRQNDSTLAILQRMENQPVAIEIYQAERLDGQMSLRGTISNMKNAVTKIPAITFEFLDEGGNVVDSQALSLAQLQPHASEDFEVTGVAQDIVAWRYTTGT